MSFEVQPYHETFLKTLAYAWLSLRQTGKKILLDMESDLTIEQGLVLIILETNDGLTLGSLAEKADRERTTISRMVSGLEKRNLVVRIPGPIDKREKLIYLTNLGRELIANMAGFQETLSERVYKGISKNQIETCLNVLRKMLNNLKGE